MQIVTKRELIANVAERWAAQYYEQGQWKYCTRGSEDVYEKLLALGDNATEGEIEAITGNGSWTRNDCNECGKSSDFTAVLGNEVMESPAYICLDCLHTAVEMIERMK